MQNENDAASAASMIFPGMTKEDEIAKLYEVTCMPPEEKLNKEEKEDTWSARRSVIVRSADAGDASSKAEAFLYREEKREYRAIEINLWGTCTNDSDVCMRQR